MCLSGTLATVKLGNIAMATFSDVFNQEMVVSKQSWGLWHAVAFGRLDGERVTLNVVR